MKASEEFNHWYEGNTDNHDFDINEYDLEECDYCEEDGTMRIELKEYDRLLNIEKKYKSLITYERALKRMSVFDLLEKYERLINLRVFTYREITKYMTIKQRDRHDAIMEMQALEIKKIEEERKRKKLNK